MTAKLILAASFGAAMLLAQPGGPRGGFGMGDPMHGPGMMMPLGPGATTTGAPYSGVETMSVQQTLAGGNQIQRSSESKVYRDSQGRVRVEHTFTPPTDATSQTPRTMITIFDPVAGYVLSSGSGEQDGSSDAAAERRRAWTDTTTFRPPTHAPNATTQTEDLGTQTVNGVAATGTRTTMTIPAGAIGNTQPIQVVREVWTSTDLKVPVLIKSSDPRFGNTTTQLTNITRGEPDPTLFQVPSGYTTVTGRGGMGSGQNGMMRQQHMRQSRQQ